MKLLTFFASIIAISISHSASASGYSADQVRACAHLTASAQAQNIQVLVIAVEGKNQFVNSQADALADYVDKRKSGPFAAALPVLGENAVLTDGLLFPLARDFGDRLNIVTFDSSILANQNVLVEKCATLWMHDPTHKLVLIGHSKGSSFVANFANVLQSKGINVDLLITIDALTSDGGTIVRPQGVATYLNFFQTVDTTVPSRLFPFPIYRGQSVGSADLDKQITDVNSHFKMPASATVYKYISSQLSSLINTRPSI
jgi:hypothetical protein